MEKEDSFISISQAAKLCDYSPEYLSFRARKGKLKSVKLGRNWFTKKEWLDEYIENIKEYKAQKKDRSVSFASKQQVDLPTAPPVEVQTVAAVLETENPTTGGSISEIANPQAKKSFLVTFTLSALIIFIIAFWGVIFAFSAPQKFNGNYTLAAMNAQQILKGTLGTFKDFGDWLGDGLYAKAFQIKNFSMAFINSGNPSFNSTVATASQEESSGQLNIAEYFSALNFFFEEGGVLQAQEVKAVKIGADKLEMRDQATGEIYCSWIEGGVWTDSPGPCPEE